jgi:hypothetical protein
MNSYSFPPADDLISILSKIDYQKLWNQFVTVLIYTGAIIYVLYTRTLDWYQNGGKESIDQTIHKLHEILSLIILWIRIDAYPTLKNAWQSVAETYQNWQQLVTV